MSSPRKSDTRLSPEETPSPDQTPSADTKLTPEESELVAAWFAEHGKSLANFARRRLGSPEAAEDVVQDTLLSAAVAVSRGDRAQVERAFLLTLLRRRIVDHLRKTVRTRRVADEYARVIADQATTIRDEVYAVAAKRWNVPPAAALEREEFWAKFEACLDEMPTLMRQAMVLRELDRLSTEEVCETLGVTKANLWTLVHRARLRLRAALGPLMRSGGK
ncbi:MAG: sigma-70 family RNA polymerase sigma factor [Planctomycetota bacterium]